MLWTPRFACMTIYAEPKFGRHYGLAKGQNGRAAALTQGQMNAFRAAFKAGVPPRRIARRRGR